jgi:hypothetical protein
LGDRRNVGESSCNSGEGTDQSVQFLMFMMMMMMMMMISLLCVYIYIYMYIYSSGFGGLEVAC